jgi:hypothetical protein
MFQKLFDFFGKRSVMAIVAIVYAIVRRQFPDIALPDEQTIVELVLALIAGKTVTKSMDAYNAGRLAAPAAMGAKLGK